MTFFAAAGNAYDFLAHFSDVGDRVTTGPPLPDPPVR